MELKGARVAMNRGFREKLSGLVSEAGETNLDNLLKKAIQLFKDTGGSSEFEAELRLANELKRVGDYSRARQIYEKLSQLDSGEGEKKAAILNNYGALMQDMGDYKRALELYEHSLHIARKALGEDHPSVATTMNNMAAVYEALGDYKRALELYEHSLNIATKVFGEEHPDVARIRNNLADVLVNLGRGQDAKRNLHEALRIMELTLGKNNQYSLILKANLSNLNRQIKQQAEPINPADAKKPRR